MAGSSAKVDKIVGRNAIGFASWSDRSYKSFTRCERRAMNVATRRAGKAACRSI